MYCALVFTVLTLPPPLSTNFTQTHTGTKGLLPSYLPVLCDGIPHPHLPCVARSHQLVPNEEEIINRYTKAEYTWRVTEITLEKVDIRRLKVWRRLKEVM